MIVAPSFADIFYSNWLGNGLLPITLPEADVESAGQGRRDRSGLTLIADVENCSLSDAFAFSAQFDRSVPSVPAAQWPRRYWTHASTGSGDISSFEQRRTGLVLPCDCRKVNLVPAGLLPLSRP